MSKQGRKAVVGRGAIAIALFEIATQLGRWADAQSRLANSNERHADLLAETVELQRAESAARIDAAVAFADEAKAKVAELMAEAEAAIPREAAPVDRITQRDRIPFFFLTDGETVDPSSIVARKSARILALVMGGPFIVETDRGPMRGVAGDYLVTNHPDDDPGSDLWTVSRARFDATYRVIRPRCGAPYPIPPNANETLISLGQRLVCVVAFGHGGEHRYRTREAVDADA